MIATFRIHPEIESYIRKQSEEENRLLEESLLAEGCRDPLVVWEEQNVLVDGHHRIAICRKHGLSYSVVYRSFPDIEAVKAWMDLNQLGRRNLSKEDRDELIRRLAAAGVPQRKIAATAKCSQGTVSNIANKMIKNNHSPTINSTSATEELEAKQQEIERLKAERDALAEKQRHEVEARARAEGDLISVKNQLEFLRNKAKAKQAPEPKVIEKPVVREVVREVVPEATQARLKDLEAQVRKTNANEQYLRNLEDRKVKLQNEIMTLKEQATKDRIEATFEKTVTFIQTEKFLASQMLEFAERGELTIEQVDQVEGILGNVLAETNNALIALRKIRGEFRQGGGLRAL